MSAMGNNNRQSKHLELIAFHLTLCALNETKIRLFPYTAVVNQMASSRNKRMSLKPLHLWQVAVIVLNESLFGELNIWTRRLILMDIFLITEERSYLRVSPAIPLASSQMVRYI